MSAHGRHPGEQRYAVIAPYAAQWLLAQMAEGRTVTRATARQHALYLRGLGHAMFATQVEGALMQLHLAASDHRASRPRPEAPLPLAGFAPETEQAKPAPAEPESPQQVSEIPTLEVAQMLGVSPQYVGRLISDGTLSARKVGGAWLVSRSSVETLAAVREAS